jgi:hypothetical protein
MTGGIKVGWFSLQTVNSKFWLQTKFHHLDALVLHTSSHTHTPHCLFLFWEISLVVQILQRAQILQRRMQIMLTFFQLFVIEIRVSRFLYRLGHHHSGVHCRSMHAEELSQELCIASFRRRRKSLRLVSLCKCPILKFTMRCVTNGAALWLLSALKIFRKKQSSPSLPGLLLGLCAALYLEVTPNLW